MSTIYFEFSPNQKIAKDSFGQNSTQKVPVSDLFPNKKGKQGKSKSSKGKNVNSINLISSVPAPEHLRKSSSVTRTRKVTVNDLLSKPDYPEVLKTERSEKPEEKSISSFVNKWKSLQSKLKETLSKLCQRKLDDLSQTIEDSYISCFSHSGLSEIAKITVLDHFYRISQKLRTFCIDLVGQKQSFKSELDFLRQENSKLREDLQVVDKPMKPIKSPPPKKLPKLASADLMKSQFEIEKAKLTEKVSLLESHLSTINSQSKVDSLAIDLQKSKELIEHWRQKNEKLNQKIKTITYKFQCEIGEIKTKAAEDKEFVKKFSDLSTGFQVTIERLEKEKKQLSDEKRLERERLLMLFEDFSKLAGYHEKYKKIADQNNSLRHRCNQLELELISGTSKRRSQGPSIVSFSGPLFEKVSDLYPFPESVETFTFSNTHTFQLAGPTFAGLLDLTEEKFSLDPQFSNWLEVHIRGIYDSKYAEHLLASPDSGRVPARFPDFVFTWLGKFCVDDKTRQVTELEWWKRETVDTIRIKFLSALKSSNLTKVWELYTFQEFLNEELLLDELAFYLHCRHLVFRGPQLSTTQGKFSTLNYVEQGYLFEVIDNVLHKLKDSDRLDIKTQLATKSKMIGEGSGIEAGFVLRLLLEFYVREKKAKFLGLSQTFLMAPTNQSGRISFRAFASICSGLYPEASELLVIKMHRLAWQTSKGLLNCSSFLIAAHECSFFYLALQLRGNFKALKLTDSLAIPDSKENRAHLMIFDLFLKNKQALNMVKEAVKGLGVPDLLETLSKFEDLMQRKLQEPLEYYNGLQLDEVFSHLWKLVVQVMIVYQEVHKNYLPALCNAEELTLSTETFIRCLQEMLLNRVVTKVAIRKIQKVWKKKAKKAVAVTATVIKSITMFKRKIKK